MARTPETTRLNEVLEDLLALSRADRAEGADPTPQRPQSPWSRSVARAAGRDD